MSNDRMVFVDRGFGPDPFPDDPWSWTRVIYRYTPGCDSYIVGSDGSAWSCVGRNGRGPTRPVWHRLKLRPIRTGIQVVTWKYPGKPRWLVRWLVLETFRGPCPPDCRPEHINGDRSNNNLQNLRWHRMPMKHRPKQTEAEIIETWEDEILALVTSGVEFRDAVGLPGFKIGDNGTLLSCRAGNGRLLPGWRIRKPNSDGHKYGHQRVMLGVDGVRHHRYIHHLVLEAFVGQCPEGMECRHLDGDATNNNLSNLVWGTRTENAADMKRHGRYGVTKGSKHPRACVTEEDIPEIRRLHAEGVKAEQLAKTYKMSPKGIREIIQGKTWKHVPMT